MNKKLEAIERTSLSDPLPSQLKKILLATAAAVLAFTLLFYNTLPQAYLRMVQPGRDFPVPLPFTLTSLSGNLDVLGGDTVSVSIAGIGDLPDSLTIHWQDQKVSGAIKVAASQEVYNYQFNRISRDTRYWAAHHSQSWFSPWDVIQTEVDTISVKDRPVVQNLSFAIIPPAYTGEGDIQHPGNITDIPLLEGSFVRLTGQSSKPLSEAWLLMEGGKIALQTKGKQISGTFPINEYSSAAVYCLDENNVQNLNPPHYRFNVIPDMPPDLIIESPGRNFELDETDLIGFDIQTSDDYGYSEAWLEYKVKAPEYLPQDTNIYTRSIPELRQGVKSQQIYHEWGLSEFSLAPEDELHIQVVVADNNTLTGPSLAKSHLLVGRYPSIEDLFERMEEEEEQVEEYSEEIRYNLEDVQELVEELELELLKSEDVSWEQEQKVVETLDKMDEIFSQIEDIQKTMEKIQEQAEKNNLVSDDLLEKFSHFQELLEQVMTPELLEAMEKLQEALEELDPQKLLDALENFEFDMEAFEEQLDRFIDMFELAMAEQKMDEVVKRLEKLAEEQEKIVEELAEIPEDLGSLASRERRQEESFKALEKAMDEAVEAMESVSPDASQAMGDLADSELTEQTKSDLNEARTEMQQQNQPNASQSAGQASGGLNEMLEMAQQIQADFQEDTVDEILRKFLALIRNLLVISQAQEMLALESEGLRSSSPKLIETAVKQDRILRENQQFMLQLNELSRETFHISPEIANAIGKTKNAMDRSIARLEQKQTSSAKKEMKSVLEGLNETAFLLLDAANEMQSSGSGSGFAQFMEQLAQMGEQQQGINEGTMKLPQMGMMAQQQMMQQLQQQQEKLKQDLEELLSENPGQDPGGLSQAGKEMEEVIEDFRRKQVDRRTQERQQRILSRMLDSQKSLTQKDYSEKRKSYTAEEIIYSGPSGLPADMGEREMLLMKAMESALQEGHSREYQEMMKYYFRSLQQAEESNDE